MMLMPAASASRVPRNLDGWPFTSNWPSKSGITPDRIFISVLLPAPFSPQIECNSPRSTSRETSESATTPGNFLVTLWMEIIVSGMAAILSGMGGNSNRRDPGGSLDRHGIADRADRFAWLHLGIVVVAHDALLHDHGNRRNG